MFEMRIYSRVAFIIFGILMCMTAWQIISYGLPVGGSQDSETAASLKICNNTSAYSHPTYLLDPNDYSRLNNLNFSFTILNLVCNNSTPLLLVLVHSAPNNFARRQTIRETWGGNTENIKIVFMIGLVDEITLQIRLDEENMVHNDFVQGNFRDTYRNITYKHIMVFKYVIYHCPQAKYILKTDDDVFVNMPTMINFLTLDLSPAGVRSALFCNVRTNSPVLRSFRSKWRVSFSEYPHRYYPVYCLGWSLLYSPDVVLSLYKEAQKADYFWIDDIHITGTLAQRINLIHTNIEPLVISDKDLKDIVQYSLNISKPFLYGRVNLQENQIRTLWKYALSHPVPKTVINEIL